MINAATAVKEEVVVVAPALIPKKRGRKPKIRDEAAATPLPPPPPPQTQPQTQPPPTPPTTVKKQPQQKITKTKLKTKALIDAATTTGTGTTIVSAVSGAASASASFLQAPKKAFFLAKIENTILHFPIKHKLDLTPDVPAEAPLVPLPTSSPFPYDPNIYVSMHADFENNTSESSSSNTFSFIKAGGVPPPPLLPNRSISIIPVLPTFFEMTQQTQTMPERTDVCCYWCTEPFSTPPLGLPERKIGKAFFVKHCFCDFPCMASYNFEKKDSLMWERYALIVLMRKSMYNLNQDVKVFLAPPREALAKFGGKYTIDEFRNLHNSKSIKVMSHPIIHIQTYLEENQLSADTHTQLQQQTYSSGGTSGSAGGSGSGSGGSSITKSAAEKQQSLLKINERYNLARTKDVLTSRNTLEFCMGLKIV
jgi:hypothetical protein